MYTIETIKKEIRRVKLRPDTTKIAALDEASTQYDKLKTLMDSDLNPEDVALGIAEDLV